MAYEFEIAAVVTIFVFAVIIYFLVTKFIEPDCGCRQRSLYSCGAPVDTEALRKALTSSSIDAEALRKALTSSTALSGSSVDTDALRKALTSSSVDMDALRKALTSSSVDMDALRKALTSSSSVTLASSGAVLKIGDVRDFQVRE